MSVHRHLDDELSMLHTLLVDMSNLVDEQLAGAITAVSTCDVVLAGQVHRRDDEVDALEMKIDHQCERILARFNPVAVDLRLIITAVKLNTDLERIGDHAKNMAKYTRHLHGYQEAVAQTRMQAMADAARALLRKAHEAFEKRDHVLAREVLAGDRQVDELYQNILAKTAELLRAQPDDAHALIQLVTMGKAVERIADHAKNIAETVVFLVEGIDIRHRRLQETGE